VSFAARKPNSVSDEYFTPDYIKERVFLNRLLLSKLSTVEVKERKKDAQKGRGSCGNDGPVW